MMDDPFVTSFPTESKVWCSMKNAKITIGLTYIIVPILCVPLYLSFAIQESYVGNATEYIVSECGFPFISRCSLFRRRRPCAFFRRSLCLLRSFSPALSLFRYPLPRLETRY